MSIPIDLQCGPLTFTFEPNTGFIRYLRLGRIEILRGIYAAVRDHNWDTVPAVLTNVRANDADARFAISFDAHCQSRDVDFTWHGTIIGDNTGRLTYELDGIANTTFRRNRIGFCVLHPPEPCKGKPCRIEKDDGSIQQGEFPLHISPHQPFKHIRAITHEVAPDVKAEVRFDGDVFEMEDQRNWTDASYKTYCTPLDRPFPVEVRKGTRVTQSVRLTLEGDPPEHVPPAHGDPSPVELSMLDRLSPLPAIGLGAASHGLSLGTPQRDRLAALNLAHLRVDLPLFETEWQVTWARGIAEASAIDVPLEVAVRLSSNVDGELSALARILTSQPAKVVRWLVFGQDHLAVDATVLAQVREVVQKFTPSAMVGSGTNAYFTELNRQRPDTASMDVVSYSINPQVHAFDDTSLVETLAMQAETLSSARAFVGDTPIAVTPVTLRPRFNPNATGPEPPAAPHTLPVQVEPRQLSLLAAAWTLGSLKYLAEAGAASVTFYETTGWRGVMETEMGSPLADTFRSTPNSVFPLYHVFADMAEFQGGQVQAMHSSKPLSAEAMLLQRGRSRRMVIANFQGRTTVVRISLPEGAEQVVSRSLHSGDLDEATRRPELFRANSAEVIHARHEGLNIELPPHGLQCLDWEASDNE